MNREAGPGRVGDLAALFFKLGSTAFGGPAAHIGLFRHEVVTRRKWLTDQRFLDLMGATNLIPGPNSTEMAIHIGYERAGWRGMLVAGTGFILPAAVLAGVMAWFYIKYQGAPVARWLLYGVKPVALAIVAVALLGLLRTALKRPGLAALAVAVLTMFLAGVNEVALLFGGSASYGLWAVRGRWRWPGAGGVAVALPIAGVTGSLAGPMGGAGLCQMFLLFLKVGAVLYGSGYVLLAFLRKDFVERLGWLSDGQLLDAIAVGQVTPGPLLTTATFVGYILGGPLGAVLATVAIFLPAFVFVAALNPLVRRLRESQAAGKFLDGVNAAALGLMGGVGYQLGASALVDVFTGLVAVAALVALRLRVNAAWLVAGGALLGAAARWLL